MSDLVFCDTNILVYAFDYSADERHTRATAVVRGLWLTHRLVISAQVLQEFHVTTRRKLPLERQADARLMEEALATLPCTMLDAAAVLSAIDRESRLQLSFWDALIIEAARRMGASQLLSEDFTHGRTYDGVRVTNPLL